MTEQPYVRRIYAAQAGRDPGQTGFLQALESLYESLAPWLEERPQCEAAALLERLGEPERTALFPVIWTDDQGRPRQSRGFHIRYTAALGPERCCLVLGPGMDLSAAKALALDVSLCRALKTAQQLGYAEADPTADVEGIDACRKTAILADLAFGVNVDPADIPTRGITAVAPADLELAQALDGAVKLLGRAARTGEEVCAFVEPHFIPQGHILASVNGVMNGCAIRGSAVGEVVLCGPGAGSHPTASAVAADIADAVRHRADPMIPDLGAPGGRLLPADELCSRWYVRAQCGPEAVSAAFPGAEPVYGSTGECGFVTAAMLDRRQLEKKLAAVNGRAAYRVLA